CRRWRASLLCPLWLVRSVRYITTCVLSNALVKIGGTALLTAAYLPYKHKISIISKGSG
ncbi:hypothetical protein V8C86DRAFT_3129086, partial [Haematococcus lacustris]